MTWARQAKRVESLLNERKRKKPPAEEEHKMQVEFRKWFDREVSEELKRRILAIPNGGKRAKKTAAKLKAEGQRKGVLDMNLPVARQGFIGFWIEFKYGKNKLTPEQKDWADFLISEGHRVEVCYSVDAAKAATKDYLGMK